jgi:hypothetical protein
MEQDHSLRGLRLGTRSSRGGHRKAFKGEIVADFQIEHTAEGWQRWREQVAVLGPGVAACVETSGRCRRATTGRRRLVVYLFRQRAPKLLPTKFPAATKPTMGTRSRRCLTRRSRLESAGQEDPLVAELRLLCRDGRPDPGAPALINQLQAPREYYPAALEAFEWTLPSAWAFLEAHPAGFGISWQTKVGEVPPY